MHQPTNLTLNYPTFSVEETDPFIRLYSECIKQRECRDVSDV